MDQSHFHNNIDSLLLKFDDSIQVFDADQHVIEQEKHISTIVEPSCMEMKLRISSLKSMLVHEHGDDNHDDDPMERWYAQTSSNIDGIYYYQPSSGNISRIVPPSYMDTSDVRRFSESKVRARSLFTPQKLARKDFNSIDVDDEFIRLVSPMRQKKIDPKLKPKQSPYSKLLRGFGLALLISYALHVMIKSAQSVPGEQGRKHLGNPVMIDLDSFNAAQRRNHIGVALLAHLTKTCIITEYNCIH